MSKFLPTIGLKWVDSEEFDLNKYTSNSSKGCVLEINVEYPKELLKLDNGYPLAPDKLEIKRKMLPEYQLKIADLYNLPTGNVKKLVPNHFDKGKYVIHYENLQLYLRLGLKLKKNASRIRIQSITMVKKAYIEFNTQKRIEAEKYNDKDGKALYKLMNNAIYGKAMENLRNRIDVKLVNNEKDYLKCTSKPTYMSHKIFDNNLVAIRKDKLALNLPNQHILECAY